MRSRTRTGFGVIFFAAVVWSCSTAESTGANDAALGGDGGESSDAGEDASADAGGLDAGDDDAGNDAGHDSGDASDAATDAGDGGPLGLTCQLACAAGEKWCSDRCVSIDDPLYGCGATTCKPGCAMTVAHARGATTCAAGACVPGGPTPTCRPGWANCDGNWATGCEADLSMPATCGACGTACAPGQVCDNGVCAAACTPPRDDCGGGSCHDFATSPNGCNCKVCPDGAGTATCGAGACGLNCDPGFGKCAGESACFDIDNDPDHCGASCEACSTATGDINGGYYQSKACHAGKCAATCWEGYTSCASGNWANCVDLKGNAEHCGGCNLHCAAGETCTSGVCAPKTSVQLVTGFISPADLAVDTNNLYVADSGGPGKVWRIEKATLTKTQVATLQPGVSSIAIDSTHVYWASTSGVYRAPIAGGAPVLLYSGTGPIAVDDTSVYFMDAVSTIWKAPKVGGGIPASLASDRKTLRLKSISGVLYGWYHEHANNTTYAFFGIDEVTGVLTMYESGSGRSGNWHGGYTTDGTTLCRVHQTNLASFLKKEPFGSLVNEKFVFAATDSFWYIESEIDPSGCGLYLGTAKGIWRVNRDNDVPFKVTSATEAPKRLAFDDTYLYWADTTWIGRLAK